MINLFKFFGRFHACYTVAWYKHSCNQLFKTHKSCLSAHYDKYIYYYLIQYVNVIDIDLDRTFVLCMILRRQFYRLINHFGVFAGPGMKFRAFEVHLYFERVTLDRSHWHDNPRFSYRSWFNSTCLALVLGFLYMYFYPEVVFYNNGNIHVLGYKNRKRRLGTLCKPICPYSL